MRAIRLSLAALALLFAATVPVHAQAPGERSALPPQDCDRACLTGIVNDYMRALGKRDASALPLARDVRYSENDVIMPLGDRGIWATATGVASTALIAADPSQGGVAWVGAVDEHGAPVFFGVRLAVRDRRITEIESVVVRNSGLPLPWGDFTKLVHDPAFEQPLTETQRRPRERLRAVADSYFNTVELNDGIVFAPFHEDCGRIENGILTTRQSALTGPGGGDASSISPGCEAQFKLGIYRINKRIRDRRYPIIDEERGVVVATGFFDHANGFDRYKLTDGREMRTALKWPNSISLIEAFKIVDGRIYRIETVFSYVPYFMPSPFYLRATPPAPLDNPKGGRCDDACLRSVGERFMTALAAQKPQDVSWAPNVRYTENGVPMMIGDGLWASIRSKGPDALTVVDASTGTIAWYGLVFDHDAPAYAGVRLKVAGDKVAEVETVVARERNPGPWLAPAQFRIDPAFTAELPRSERTSRSALVAAVDQYAKSAVARQGRPTAKFTSDCARRENGQVVSARGAASAVIVRNAGDLAEGCEAQLALGLYRPLEALRARRVVAVDETRGLVVVQALADFPLRDPNYTLADGRAVETSVRYPSTRELFEVYRVRAGRIERIDAVSVFQPYFMATPWVASAN